MAGDYSTIRPLVDKNLLTINLLDRRLVEPDHVKRVEAELCAALDKHQQERVILNFDGVEFLSSAMLGTIIVVHGKVVDRGGQLAICGLTKDIQKVFKMMRLDTRVRIFKTLDKARSALA